jgi:PAS domain-containing protein
LHRGHFRKLAELPLLTSKISWKDLLGYCGKGQESLGSMHRELWAVGKTVGLVDPSGLAFWLLGSLLLALLLLGLQQLSVLRRILRFPFQLLRGTPSPEARFRAALEASLDAIYLLEAVRDPVTREIRDFVFVDVNAKGEELISLQRRQIIGQRLCELLPINRWGGFFEKYKRVVETGIPLEEEFPISGQPGLKASWIHHQVVPVGDGILITSRDISEQVQIKQALEASELRYRALYEAIPDLIFEIDPEGLILNCKPSPYVPHPASARVLCGSPRPRRVSQLFRRAVSAFSRAGPVHPNATVSGVRNGAPRRCRKRV